MASRRVLSGVELERYRSTLLPLIRDVEARLAVGARPQAAEFDRMLRRHPREGRGFFSRSALIAGHRAWSQRDGLRLDSEDFARRLRLRPTRSLSGVTPVTVFTRPHPCPGHCIFCPNDVRMPKSYLRDEPGAQRAEANGFDPYLQTWRRLEAYRAIGHPTDKIEVIVLGGTWSAYPEPYQRWFVGRVLAALNDYQGDARSPTVGSALPAGAAGSSEAAGRSRAGRAFAGRYNRVVARRTSAGVPPVGAAQLAALQRANETAACRLVGLVVETRPDACTRAEVLRMRRLGCTKVQIGLQSLDDEVLAANRRGHDVGDARRALRRLRAAGFKVHAHWMPNLLGSTPERDARDFARLFDDPDFRPDELKIYPCSLVESAELMTCYERGEWRPWSHDELLDVLVAALERTPRWCRLTRVIRDISSDDIIVGNKLTHFREVAEAELERRGGRCVDIRAREVRGRDIDAHAFGLRASEYAASPGRELFLEYVDAEDRIAAFLRLSLPSVAAASEAPEEVRGSAFVRELHVYGAAQPLGASGGGCAQHRGFGSALLEEAARRAAAAGYRSLSVISAAGTRDYYRRRGFRDGILYQHRALPTASGAGVGGRSGQGPARRAAQQPRAADADGQRRADP